MNELEKETSVLFSRIAQYGRGFSVPNLQGFRRFFLGYPERGAIWSPTGTKSLGLATEKSSPLGTQLAAGESGLALSGFSPDSRRRARLPFPRSSLPPGGDAGARHVMPFSFRARRQRWDDVRNWQPLKTEPAEEVA